MPDRGADGKFARGNRFGPGRVLGSRNKLTQWEQELRKQEGPIIKSIVARAQAGEATAMQIAARYLAPSGRRRKEPLDLPRPTDAASIVLGLGRLVQLFADRPGGRLPNEIFAAEHGRRSVYWLRNAADANTANHEPVL